MIQNSKLQQVVSHYFRFDYIYILLEEQCVCGRVWWECHAIVVRSMLECGGARAHAIKTIFWITRHATSAKCISLNSPFHFSIFYYKTAVVRGCGVYLRLSHRHQTAAACKISAMHHGLALNNATATKLKAIFPDTTKKCERQTPRMRCIHSL